MNQVESGVAVRGEKKKTLQQQEAKIYSAKSYAVWQEKRGTKNSLKLMKQKKGAKKKTRAYTSTY